MDNLVVGDVVLLKSGGPDMTVKKIDGELISCTWFDARKKLIEGDFLLTTLTKAQNMGDVLKAFAKS